MHRAEQTLYLPVHTYSRSLERVAPGARLAFGLGMRCAARRLMRRLWLLSVLLLPQLGRAQGDAGAPLDEAGQLMREGLERDLPAPSLHPTPRWPTAEGHRPPALPPGAVKVDALTERVRNEASSRARAVAEDPRTVPDEQPGVGQSRTRAAKAVGPPLRPRPPRP